MIAPSPSTSVVLAHAEGSNILVHQKPIGVNGVVVVVADIRISVILMRSLRINGHFDLQPTSI